MALRATHVPSGTEITIGPVMDAVSRAVVDEVYQNCSAGVLECREHDNDPYLAHLRDLVDGRVHGAWVHIRKNPARTKWVLAHSPSGVTRGFHSHEVPVGKSDLHQWEQDYLCRAADDVGFPSDQEVVLASGTRLDVQVEGSAGLVGFEVQHSFLSVPKVRNRTRKATSEGIPLVWCADSKGPDWAFKVPHVEANEGVPGSSAPRGSWTVTTGPRRIIRIKCEPRNADRLPRCRKPGRRRRNWCGGYHPVFEPVYGLTVDFIAQRVPSGLLVPLNTYGKQGVILTPAEDYDLWQNEFADLAQPREREPNDARPCGYRPALRARLCSKCSQAPVGAGGILCNGCQRDLCGRGVDDWYGR